MTLIYSSEVSTIPLNYNSKIHKNAPKIKCYLYKASCVFKISYMIYLAQNLQLCLGTLHPHRMNHQL